MISLPQGHVLGVPGSYIQWPLNLSPFTMLPPDLAKKHVREPQPQLGRGYHRHRSSLAIITHLCLRNINHPLAASQVYVRAIKEFPPVTPLCCLDCKSWPYRETHRSLPNRFPQQPRQSGQAPRSPGLGGPAPWLPVPPLTWRRQPLSSCLNLLPGRG